MTGGSLVGNTTCPTQILATLSAAGLPTMDGPTGTAADRAKRWRLIRSLLRLRGVEQYLDSESPAPHWIGGQEGVDGVSSAFNPGLSLGGGECRQGILVGQQSLPMQGDEGIGERSDRLGMVGVIALQTLVSVVATEGHVGVSPFWQPPFRFQCADQEVRVAAGQSMVDGQVGGADGEAQPGLLQLVGWGAAACSRARSISSLQFMGWPPVMMFGAW